MSPIPPLRTSLTLAVLALALLAAQAPPPESDDSQVDFFEKSVRPLLQKNCFRCHGGESPTGRVKYRGGLDITSREGLLEGGDTGPAVDLENPADSLLLEMVSYKDEDHEMPPAGRLPQEAIDAVARWVETGLPWSGGDRTEPAKKQEEERDLEAEIGRESQEYWAYQPVRRPVVPRVETPGWQEHPVDAFLARKLEEAGLSPNPPASRQALMRRVTHDLTGLPPSPDEVEAFVQDSSPDAWEKLIDRLLESPHFGEKWARHWLDLVRYAESNGYERDSDKKEIWRYRDYVIRAFNDDKPYDRFIREQLAGDELDDVTADSLMATGYYRLHLWDDEPVDRKQARYDNLDDIVRTTSESFLGMTLGCARCHDHKKDPIRQRDYYAFMAFFNNITPMDKNNVFRSLEGLAPGASAVGMRNKHRERWKELEERLTAFEYLARETLHRRGDLRDTARAFKPGEALFSDSRPEPQRLPATEVTAKRVSGRAMCVAERGTRAPEMHIHIRGNAGSPGEKVEPAFPAVLRPPQPVFPDLPAEVQSTGRRRALAEWVASPENPLTARVLVNRLWQHYFGRAIVATPNDFGRLGEQPTHPELIDWLAVELLEGDWKLKRLHRLILLSNAYRMSSRANEAALRVDPENRLFWRKPMRRLTAEEIRDSILVVSGNFNPKMHGPSMFPRLPDEVLATSSTGAGKWGRSPAEETARRSIYIKVKRSLLVPFLTDFDFADTDAPCAVRFTSTVPSQALGMLNSRFVNEQAALFAKRLRREHPGDPGAQIRRGLELVTARMPKREEIRSCLAFLESLEQGDGLGEMEALNRFALLALNLNEFIYLD